MIDPETSGKIIGMVLAYTVSSLGLLLAYYNYRKRIIKADVIFTNTAKAVIALIIGLVFIALIVIGISLRPENTPVASTLPGIIIPLAILVLSIWVTWLLFKHFSKQIGD